MEITRAGHKPHKLANPDYFTGQVWQELIAEAPAPARVRALRVTFAPGARTAWHTHPLGQTLHVVSGVGLVGLLLQRLGHAHLIEPIWIGFGKDVQVGVFRKVSR